MKPTPFIPPVVALVIAGGWLGSQRQSIATLEQESALLRKSIAARSSGAGGDSPQAKSAPSGKSAKDKERMDWKKIAAQFAESQHGGGMGDMRNTMKFQVRVQAMTQEELVTALDEIAALDLTADSRSMLEQMLLEPLTQKAPELALNRFIGRSITDGTSMGWQLSQALQEWAEKDPARATAWFDQQIAAGKFDSKSLDGKSPSRNQFEGSLIQILLASDPDAAGRRLGAMPEDQRGEIITNYSFHQLKEEDQLAHAKLVRSQLPEKDQAGALTPQASRMVSSDGYSKVTEYLDRIQATPAERVACAEAAAQTKLMNRDQKKVTRENLDEMREWVRSQAPEALGSITGKSLGHAMQGNDKMEFAEAADLAAQYDQASGNDEVVGAFLEASNIYGNKEQARILVEKISDVKRREQILERLK